MDNPGAITLEQVAEAISHVENLDFYTKVNTLESIGKAQPAVTGAVVQMTRMGVDNPTAEHAFHVLLVLHECFVRDVPDLGEISLDMFEDAMRNNEALLELLDKETHREAKRLQRMSITTYPELNVQAFVTGYLQEQGLAEFSQANELVVRVCKAIMDSFVEAKRLAKQPQT